LQRVERTKETKGGKKGALKKKRDGRVDEKDVIKGKKKRNAPFIFQEKGREEVGKRSEEGDAETKEGLGGGGKGQASPGRNIQRYR